mmetsp:Transcript_22117/g.61397  ORF Transcript_22117/g.61397 Transcript_22117/m.61397 type:complete len:332 (-) Transcript_22117:205-1200(-)
MTSSSLAVPFACTQEASSPAHRLAGPAASCSSAGSAGPRAGFSTGWALRDSIGRLWMKLSASVRISGGSTHLSSAPAMPGTASGKLADSTGLHFFSPPSPPRAEARPSGVASCPQMVLLDVAEGEELRGAPLPPAALAEAPWRRRWMQSPSSTSPPCDVVGADSFLGLMGGGWAAAAGPMPVAAASCCCTADGTYVLRSGSSAAPSSTPSSASLSRVKLLNWRLPGPSRKKPPEEVRESFSTTTPSSSRSSTCWRWSSLGSRSSSSLESAASSYSLRRTSSRLSPWTRPPGSPTSGFCNSLWGCWAGSSSSSPLSRCMGLFSDGKLSMNFS